MRYLFLFLLPLLFSNCEKEEIILFEMDFRQDFEIPAGLNTIETHHFLIRDVGTNLATYLATFDNTESEIVVINPKTARIESLFSNVEYDIIQEISVRVFKDDPLDYQEIFYREDVPFNTSDELFLLPTLVDLKALILEEEQFDIDVAIRFRQAPAQFIETRLTFDLLVK